MIPTNFDETVAEPVTMNKKRKKTSLVEFANPSDEGISPYREIASLGGDEMLDKQIKYDFNQFTDLGSGIYTMCGRTLPVLPAGVYSIVIPQNGIPLYISKDIKSDKWLSFNDKLIKGILDEIDTFWTKTKEFEKYGVLQRRGYLLYGPAGTGKTILVKQIMTKIIQNDGLVFLCSSPGCLVRGIDFYRKIQPNRKIVVVMEDIDTIVRVHGEDQILQYLDGEDSNNFILNIATTNYPEKLDRRIVQRPRRFDRIIKIGYPNSETRRYYFTEKLGLTTEDEIEKWVNGTKNFSFAALTDMVISVKCLDVPFDEAKERIAKIMTSLPDSKEYEKEDYVDNASVSMGFIQ